MYHFISIVVTFLFARPKIKVTKRKRAPKSKTQRWFPNAQSDHSPGAAGARGMKTHPSSPARKPVDFGSKI